MHALAVIDTPSRGGKIFFSTLSPIDQTGGLRIEVVIGKALHREKNTIHVTPLVAGTPRRWELQGAPPPTAK